MSTNLKPSFGLLTVTLAIAGCSTIPFWPQQPTSKAPATKAPVVDRSVRRPPVSATPAEVGQLPQDDPLLPREYSSAYPPASDPYAASERPYPPDSNNVYRQPAYPRTGNTTQAPSSYPYPANTAQPAYPRTGNTTQAPSYPYGGNTTQPPAYPPGAAAASRPSSPQPYSTPSSDGYDRAPSPAPAYSTPSQNADSRYGAAPTPGSLPEPQPVVPKAPPIAARPPIAKPSVPDRSDNTTVATAQPPTSAEPAPPPAQPQLPAPRPAAPPASPPADLPPAEITREGNQAVAALLESADKSVKSNQLDKAGAALERALRIEPRNAGIWHDLAQIRLHQGQYQQAESLASKSSNLASGNRTLQARNWRVIAAARKAAGNMAGAEEAEARAAQLAH